MFDKLKITVLSLLLALPSTACARQERSEPVPTVTLNNGVKMPILGLGTMSLDGAVGENSVAEAISLGYRLFDTARVYGNEEAVGKGIKKSGIDREELFITTKLWADDMGYDKAREAFEASLKRLGLDYVDLYLIHRPRPKEDIQGSWRAMEELYEAGRIRAIGVSNFTAEQLEELLSYAKVTPAVNQIETHPFFHQFEAQDRLGGMGIQMEAWSPLAGGRGGIFDNPVLAAIGKKYGKTNAQVALRWIVQRGIVAIPRTPDREHMLENLDIFDFELDEDDLRQIAVLDLDTSRFPEWD